jgi:hypothetical protein
MFVISFYFVSYYFFELNMMIFFNFQETYNSRLRERYGDDPSTHSDFDLDLWMEVGSSGGPNKNQVYRLSNTTAENLQASYSVSTVGTSQSVSSTQFEEFMALKQQYERLLADYEQLRQMVMDIRLQIGDTCAPPFWSFSPRNNQSPPSPLALPLL